MTESASALETRVSLLIYRVNPSGKLRFREDIPVRMESTLDGFTAVIEPPSGIFKPTRDFHSVEGARAILDPQLEAWRAWVRLTEGGDLLAFEIHDTLHEAVNVPPGSGHLVAGPVSIQCVGSVALLFEGRDAVPGPPKTFIVDDLVRVGIALYNDAETLPRHSLKISYAYLTMIEHEYGGPASAARRLGIHKSVL